MAKKNNGFTRQGVRDLSSIKAKPKGIRVELPPDADLLCQHRIMFNARGVEACVNCGQEKTEIFTKSRY